MSCDLKDAVKRLIEPAIEASSTASQAKFNPNYKRFWKALHYDGRPDLIDRIESRAALVAKSTVEEATKRLNQDATNEYLDCFVLLCGYFDEAEFDIAVSLAHDAMIHFEEAKTATDKSNKAEVKVQIVAAVNDVLQGEAADMKAKIETLKGAKSELKSRVAVLEKEREVALSSTEEDPAKCNIEKAVTLDKSIINLSLKIANFHAYLEKSEDRYHGVIFSLKAHLEDVKADRDSWKTRAEKALEDHAGLKLTMEDLQKRNQELRDRDIGAAEECTKAEAMITAIKNLVVGEKEGDGASG